MRPDPYKQEGRTVIRAGHMSRSGDYSNWQEIQAALVAEGFEDAPGALDSGLLRKLLNLDCADAQRKRNA